MIQQPKLWHLFMPGLVCAFLVIFNSCSSSCSETPPTGNPFEKELNSILYADQPDLPALVALLNTPSASQAPVQLVWTARRYACQWAVGQKQFVVADTQCSAFFNAIKGNPGSIIGEGKYTELLRFMAWRWLNDDNLDDAKKAVFYGDVVMRHMIDYGLAVSLAEQAEFALLRGLVFWKRDIPVSAQNSLEEARTKSLLAIGERPALTLQVLETLGDFYAARGDTESAFVAYRQGMDQCVGLGDAGAAGTIRFRLKLASVQFAAGRIQDAYAWLLQAQPLCGEDPRTSPLNIKTADTSLCIMVWQNIEKVTAALGNERRHRQAVEVLKRWNDFYNPGQEDTIPGNPAK